MSKQYQKQKLKWIEQGKQQAMKKELEFLRRLLVEVIDADVLIQKEIIEERIKQLEEKKK